MPAPDRFPEYRAGADGPASQMFAITPSDVTDLAFLTSGLYVGGAGDIAVQGATGASVLFKAVPVGSILPIRASRILASGTTATNIVGLA
jgi:hypothetical protein